MVYQTVVTIVDSVFNQFHIFPFSISFPKVLDIPDFSEDLDNRLCIRLVTLSAASCASIRTLLSNSASDFKRQSSVPCLLPRPEQ